MMCSTRGGRARASVAAGGPSLVCEMSIRFNAPAAAAMLNITAAAVVLPTIATTEGLDSMLP